MASDHKALYPYGSALRIKEEFAGLFQKCRENRLRFQARQWRSHAVMDASPKPDMASRYRPIEDNLIRVGKGPGVSIGGTPEKKQGGVSRNLNPSELCIF
jgi:hypothetical protein